VLRHPQSCRCQDFGINGGATKFRTADTARGRQSFMRPRRVK
jgi:hypothetical protein